MIDIEKRDIIKKSLAQNGGVWVDLPLLLPASTVLELAGEQMRPRLYFATSPNGQELCLRADLTIPAALTYIENHKDNQEKAIYLCSGKVFRANQNDGLNPEFAQIGIERYNDEDSIKADCETFASIFNSCKIMGLGASVLTLSDGGIIEFIIKNSNIEDPWKQYLLDVAGEIADIKKRISFAVKAEKKKPSALEASIVELSDEAAKGLLEEVLGLANLKYGLARTTGDIANRLKKKASYSAALPLDADKAKAIIGICEVKDKPFEAIAKMVDLASILGVDLSNWQKDWQERLENIKNTMGDEFADAVFDISLQRRFEYYDGMIFDIHIKDKAVKPVANGGRYDGLINELTKGSKNAKAVGAVIRPQVLLSQV